MRRKLILTILFIISIIPVKPAGLHAADLSVGATGWYTAWDYKDDASSDVEYSPSFLYGPVLSLAMTQDINMSFVFLYGEFDMDTGSETIPIKRYDSDLTLNYRISSYFKLFLGGKYVGFTWSDNGKHQALGPGAGISSVIPIGGNFFILGYISGMYLKGSEEGDKNRSYNAKADEYGCNASLSLAYYIPAASTTVSLGGRYQQININYDSTENGYVSDSISRFYGVTLTAIYSFNI